MDPAILIHNFTVIGNILQTLAVGMGVALFVSGLFTMKRYGEMRTFMSHQMTLAMPLIKMLGGVMLLILSTVIKTGLYSFFGSFSPMQYVPTGDAWNGMVEAIIIFVRVVGVGACIRGIVLFSRTGIVGGPPGTGGKAFIHFLGGLLLINIVATSNLLANIFGVTI